MSQERRLAQFATACARSLHGDRLAGEGFGRVMFARHVTTQSASRSAQSSGTGASFFSRSPCSGWRGLLLGAGRPARLGLRWCRSDHTCAAKSTDWAKSGRWSPRSMGVPRLAAPDRSPSARSQGNAGRHRDQAHRTGVAPGQVVCQFRACLRQFSAPMRRGVGRSCREVRQASGLRLSRRRTCL